MQRHYEYVGSGHIDISYSTTDVEVSIVHSTPIIWIEEKDEVFIRPEQVYNYYFSRLKEILYSTPLILSHLFFNSRRTTCLRYSQI